MLIDWFTVAAQIVNFLILVALLKHFLYDRILQAMDAREAQIRERLQQADQKEAEAEREAASLREKQAALEDEKAAIFEKARTEAEEKRKALSEQARREADALRDKWKREIRRSQEAFLRDFRRMAGDEVFSVARKALRDLAEAEVEAQAVGRFLEQLRQITKTEAQQMAASLEKEGAGALIRSGFETTPALQRKITRGVHENIAPDIEVEYEAAPELLLGIELKAGGRRLAWSLETYLDGLEKSARRLLEAAGAENEKNGQSR